MQPCIWYLISTETTRISSNLRPWGRKNLPSPIPVFWETKWAVKTENWERGGGVDLRVDLKPILVDFLQKKARECLLESRSDFCSLIKFHTVAV